MHHQRIINASPDQTRPDQTRIDQDREDFNLADLFLELAFLFSVNEPKQKISQLLKIRTHFLLEQFKKIPFIDRGSGDIF